MRTDAGSVLSMGCSNVDRQQGFSLVEVLVVLVVSGAILVSLSSMVLMSQRSVGEFSNADAIDSKYFFFEEQFAKFVNAITIGPHPDAREPCDLSGTGNRLEGCFFDVFSQSQPIERFTLAVEQQETGAQLSIRIAEQQSVWFQHDGAIEITFFDQAGRARNDWPPTSGPSVSRVNRNPDAEDPVLPAAISVKFGRSPSMLSERVLFVSFKSS